MRAESYSCVANRSLDKNNLHHSGRWRRRRWPIIQRSTASMELQNTVRRQRCSRPRFCSTSKHLEIEIQSVKFLSFVLLSLSTCRNGLVVRDASHVDIHSQITWLRNRLSMKAFSKYCSDRSNVLRATRDNEKNTQQRQCLFFLCLSLESKRDEKHSSSQ